MYEKATLFAVRSIKPSTKLFKPPTDLSRRAARINKLERDLRIQELNELLDRHRSDPCWSIVRMAWMREKISWLEKF